MNAEPLASTGTDEPDPAAPCDALADVWDALDVLPRASGSTDMAATTVEMVAVAAERRRSPLELMPRWLLPAALVTACLVAGVIAGRLTAREPPAARSWPLIGHLDLLREAGSVKFLEEVAKRKSGPLARFAQFRNPEGRRFEADAFRQEITALGDQLAAAAAGDRGSRQQLSPERQVELEHARAAFANLSTAERRVLEETARALVDRPELQDAALLWRQRLAVLRPDVRAGIISKPSKGRLEWLDYFAARPEGAGGGRPPRDVERRGQPRGPEGRPRRPPAVSPDAPPPGPRAENAAPRN